MLYKRQISTAANTTKANAVKTQIRAWAGVITKIQVRFPPGPRGLLHVVIKLGGIQIFPIDILTDVAGEDEPVTSEEFVVMSKGWNNLNIFTWNESTKYSHDCIVRITVLPHNIADPFSKIAEVATSLRFILRRIGLPI